MEKKSNKDSVADYRKKMKEIKVRVPYTPGTFDEKGNPVSEDYEKIRTAAESHSMSINEYILYLVGKDIGEELNLGVKGLKKAITTKTE